MFLFVSVICFGFFYVLRGLFFLKSKSIKDETNSTDDEDDDDIKAKETKYEDKYIDVLEEVKKKSTSPNNISNNNFLMETTPNGNVIMKYSAERQSFEYYSDKDIPYKYLETVARKFVKLFFCYENYIITKTKYTKINGNMVRYNEKNRFTHLGKLNNFNMLQKVQMPTQFSYRKFKSIF
jgi:hypothetical protein